MLFTCLKLLQTNYSKYAISFNMITNDFLLLLCCTVWKIEKRGYYLLWLSLSLIALTNTQDMLLSSLFHSDENSSSFGSEANTAGYCHSDSAYRFQSHLQCNLQNIPFFYYWRLWIIFQEQFSSVSFFSECHRLTLFLLCYYWLSLWCCIEILRFLVLKIFCCVAMKIYHPVIL